MRALLIAFLLVGSGCTSSNAFFNCGNLGGTCCPDRSCKPGGSCQGNSCVACGNAGQACCAGGQCGGGMACANGTCTTCGGPGQPCCAGNQCGGACCVQGNCVAAGSSCPSINQNCNGNGSCGNCGGPNQPCCPTTLGNGNPTCTAAGVACNGTSCVACGAAGQPCCSRGSCTGGGLACADQTRVCEPCGGAGQICCPGDTCNASGLACGDGICVACGNPGERCCTGAGCNGGCCDPQGITCVAHGSMCSTGGACANNTCGTATQNMCGGGATFPDFAKGCDTNAGCVVALHQVDCCGSKDAIGIALAQQAAFTTAEATWDSTCPACRCAPQPTTAEDGRMCASNAVTVACDNNHMCRTACP
jgi:hypothetical protein